MIKKGISTILVLVLSLLFSMAIGEGPADNTHNLTFYWNNPDGNYDNCDVWIWYETSSGETFSRGYLLEPCDYGATATIGIPSYVSEVGFIVRRECSNPGGDSWDNAVKDYDGDRYVTMTGDSVVIYLKSGDKKLYSSSDDGVTLTSIPGIHETVYGKDHDSLEIAYVVTDEELAQEIPFSAMRYGESPLYISYNATEQGTLRFSVVSYDYDIEVRVYDRNGSVMDKHIYQKENEKHVFSYALNKGELISFSIDMYNLAVRNNGVFSICFDGHHLDNNYSEITKDATCTESGTLSYYCKLCNEIIRTEEIPCLGHEASNELTVVKDATCTESGIEGHLCTRCSDVLDSQEIEALGHTEGKGYVIKEASCLAEGLIEYRCERCNEVLSTEKIAKKEHTPGKFELYKSATCTSEGIQAQYCTECGELLKTNPLPALGHTPGKWEVVKEATENSEGLMEQKCVECGEVLQSQTIQPTGNK